jgi:hypothetical protein
LFPSFAGYLNATFFPIQDKTGAGAHNRPDSFWGYESALSHILKIWSWFGTSDMRIVLDSGDPMSWMSSIATWIAAICVVAFPESNVRTAGMNIF